MKDPRYEHLVARIVDDAKGVFLWVYLAVISILQGLTNADRMEDLENRLSRVPKTLEEYFQHMLDSVDDEYRDSGPRQIQIALNAVGNLDLMHWWFLDGGTLDFAFMGKSGKSSLERRDIEDILDIMRRRLQARCKGLLEIVVESEENTQPSYTGDDVLKYPRIDFLHRTVRDYLLQPHMQAFLQSRLPPTFNPRIEVCQALLAFVKDQHRPGDYFFSIQHDAVGLLMAYCKQVELDCEELPQRLHEILDEAEEALIFQYKRAHSKDVMRNVFFTIAVNKGLRLYLSSRLSADPALVHDKQTPLLASALGLVSLSGDRQGIDQEMLKVLLAHGANPAENMKRQRESQSGKITVWGHFLLDLYDNRHPQFRNSIELYDVLQLLISHGADTSEQIHIRTEYKPTRRDTGRASDLFKNEVREPIYEKASSIIMQILPREQATRLTSKANKKQKFARISRLFSLVARKC